MTIVPPSKVPLCIRCRFYGRAVVNGQAVDQCKHPGNSFFDPVTGALKSYDPSWLRALDRDDKCGPEGRWWEGAL